METISDEKKAEREEIERQTREFIKNGGEIEKVPDRYEEFATGIRYGAANRIKREIDIAKQNKLDAIKIYQKTKDKKYVCKKFRISEHTLDSWICKSRESNDK